MSERRVWKVVYGEGEQDLESKLNTLAEDGYIVFKVFVERGWYTIVAHDPVLLATQLAARQQEAFAASTGKK